MRVIEVVVDIPVEDIASAKSFYQEFLGLSSEQLGLGWVSRFLSPDTGAQVQLITEDASAPENPLISVKVDDVHAAHAQALERGLEIVHPLTTEPWGITRFFVRAPDGTVVNIAQHRVPGQ
jgi:predicted enzyme related to lactoylglutathione lyase